MSTLRAAIYARKSTEQNGLAKESKSVERQVEHATAFAARKGWMVDSASIFIDDGVSGALFGDKRPGLARLLNALSPRPPFQVLVMSEESRLGREAIETGWTLKRITDAGVRVFFYLEDRERTLDSATDKVMMSLSASLARCRSTPIPSCGGRFSGLPPPTEPSGVVCPWFALPRSGLHAHRSSPS